MSAWFGPAGNAESFTRAGFRETASAPAWLAGMGLNAYEYQCGRGVRIGTETAHKIREQACRHGIILSLHAPYFINLSSEEQERIEKNIDYVLQSCRAAHDLGADRIVIHCGGMGKLTRARAMENTVRGVRALLEQIENAGYGTIRLCLETMGKLRQMGTAEEVFQLVALDERLLPCIDFGHLNARTQGQMRTREQIAALFDQMEHAIGLERARQFHSHFSHIEYGKSGEIRHLTFADTVYGPEFEPVAREAAARGYTPRFICESAGTQAEDALTMKQIFEQIEKEGL